MHTVKNKISMNYKILDFFILVGMILFLNIFLMNVNENMKVV